MSSLSWSDKVVGMASEKHPVLPLSAILSLPQTQTGPGRHGLLALVSLLALGVFVYCESFARLNVPLWIKPRKLSYSAPVGLPAKVQRRWGQYSPYFREGEYAPPPEGCEVSQVNILQRHGARYPNEGDDYDKSVSRLMSAKKFLDPKLDFLKHYKYDLQEESLTPLGAEQSFEAGIEAFRRYSHLVTPHMLPFVRASGVSRVINSAGNWTVGFAAASKHHVHPAVDQILSESVNNTLNADCPNSDEGDPEKDSWLAVFTPPLLKYLRKAAPKAKITKKDVHNLMAMCPFESLALQKPSPFCGIFKAKEFANFEYYGDVEKYYKTGYGNALGPIQGVGYVNELLARLTNQPVQDQTQHNFSLPFPLDRTMYVDFTHENSQVAVFTTLGLFNVSKAPDPEKMEEKPSKREWMASRMVPFSGRMVVEKLACKSEELTGKGGEFVRI
ncbi:histidine phosphatase superfamily, partial [Cytidiella melzeri]